MSSVRAALNYSVDNGRPIDYYFYEPDPALELNPPGTDTREMEIRDGWPLADRFSADCEGFEIGHFAAGFTDFDDDAAIEAGFYPQVIGFVKRHTAAKRVEVFDHTIRRRLPDDLSQQTEVRRPAVQLVHCDYTPKSRSAAGARHPSGGGGLAAERKGRLLQRLETPVRNGPRSCRLRAAMRGPSPMTTC